MTEHGKFLAFVDADGGVIYQFMQDASVPKCIDYIIIHKNDYRTTNLVISLEFFQLSVIHNTMVIF